MSRKKAGEVSGNATGKVTGNATGDVTDKVLNLVRAIGNDILSVKEIMERLNLKGDDHFRKTYLKPALDGYKDELKPAFKSTPTQFQTIIYAATDTTNVGENVGDMSEREITDRQQNILNLIKESPTITAKQMSERLSVTQRTIERDIAILKKKNRLRRNGNDYDGEWIII